MKILESRDKVSIPSKVQHVLYSRDFKLLSNGPCINENTFYHSAASPAGYSGFQVTGMFCVFFSVWLDLSRDLFFVYSKQSEDTWKYTCVSRPCIYANKLQLNFKQKMFLGVCSIVRMTNRRGRDKFRLYDE